MMGLGSVTLACVFCHWLVSHSAQFRLHEPLIPKLHYLQALQLLPPAPLVIGDRASGSARWAGGLLHLGLLNTFRFILILNLCLLFTRLFFWFCLIFRTKRPSPRINIGVGRVAQSDILIEITANSIVCLLLYLDDFYLVRSLCRDHVILVVDWDRDHWHHVSEIKPVLTEFQAVFIDGGG